ncbi:MAG TPA: DUF1876 domain-containing protein [Micromonosporaceae bacterium]|nr:DUF1876 domain-containing protein [Micromonosporaceae bacterium]
MTAEKRWTIDIIIDEHDDQRRTRAEARLNTGAATAPLCGSGTARRNPVDREVPEIGDEVAVARALFDLAHQLLLAAVLDIEQVSHEPARVGMSTS